MERRINTARFKGSVVSPPLRSSLLLYSTASDWAQTVSDALETDGRVRVAVETEPVGEHGTDDTAVDGVLIDSESTFDWLDVLKRVSEQPPNRPVVVCADAPSASAVRTAIAAGATEFIERDHLATQHAVATHRLTRLLEEREASDDRASREKPTRGGDDEAKSTDREIRGVDSDRDHNDNDDNGRNNDRDDLSTFIQQSPIGFIEWDRSFRIVRVNRAAESILGEPESALRGRSWRELVSDADHETIETKFEALWQTGGEQRETIRFNTSEGDEGFCRCHTRVITDEGGVVAAFSKFEDITKQRETEHQLAQYASTLTQLQRTAETLLAAETPAEAADIVVDSLTEVFEFDLAGVWLITDEGNTLEPVAMSEPSDELIAEPPTYTPDEPSLSWTAYTEQSTRLVDDMRAETDRHNPDTPIRSELIVPLGRYGVLNIGAKQPHAFSRQDAHRLESWAKTVTAALARIEQLATLKQREGELERERNRLDAFTSTVTHDLRNPLTVAAGRLDLLAADCDSEHIGPIERSLTRMERLIDELTELAREGNTVGETERVDIASMARESWEMTETRGATLRCETDATIEADRTRLAALFENLFHNAVDHGEADTITVGALPDERGFFVDDDGTGLGDDGDHIFARGYSTRPEGTGYGLSIVREIVEAHGWEITATHGDTGGARFEICGVEFGANAE